MQQKYVSKGCKGGGGKLGSKYETANTFEVYCLYAVPLKPLVDLDQDLKSIMSFSKMCVILKHMNWCSLAVR